MTEYSNYILDIVKTKKVRLFPLNFQQRHFYAVVDVNWKVSNARLFNCLLASCRQLLLKPLSALLSQLYKTCIYYLFTSAIDKTRCLYG